MMYILNTGNVKKNIEIDTNATLLYYYINIDISATNAKVNYEI